MVGAVGDPIAHNLARPVTVRVDAQHARRDDRDLIFAAAGLLRAGADSFFRPLIHFQIEAGAENHAVGAAAGKLQSFGSFRAAA